MTGNTSETTNEETQASSCMEVTKDLMMVESKEVEGKHATDQKEKGDGVDWGWGSDDSDREEEGEPQKAANDDAQDEVDSDATAAMTDQSEGEDDFDVNDADDATVTMQIDNDMDEIHNNDNINDKDSEISNIDIDGKNNYEQFLSSSTKQSGDAETASDSIQEDAKATTTTSTTSEQEDKQSNSTEIVDQESSAPMEKKEAAKEKKQAKESTATEAEQPDEDALLLSTDLIFQDTDPDNVTVKDIIRLLEKEFGCKLIKSNRKIVKKHLVDLMLGNVMPSQFSQSQTQDELTQDDQEENDNPMDEEIRESNLEKDVPMPKDVQAKEGNAETSSQEAEGSKEEEEEKEAEQPDEDALITSTDFLFVHADKRTVTIKDILKSLAAEYDCELSVENRKFVKNHLRNLIQGKSIPTVENQGESEDDDVEEDKEDVISEQGDSDSEASAYDEDSESEAAKVKSRRKAAMHSKRANRVNQKKAAKTAKLVEVRRLRKKRMEELKIRNEEMQLNESKADQERAELIAAKFETNTDEQRMKRLEGRLELLQQLDKTRIAVVQGVEKSADRPNEENEVPATPKKMEANEEESSDEESSSDEEDLELVGPVKKIKPLAPLPNQRRSRALDVLQMLRSPTSKPVARSKKTLSKTSPTKRLGFRESLRNQLKQKQRKVGNRWLARELGYKTEEDHLKDCQVVVEKKREQVLKLEEARIQANERKKLRQRLMMGDAEAENDEEDESAPSPSIPEEEEDEEMQLAKEIEGEKESNEKTSAENERTNDNVESEEYVSKGDSPSQSLGETDLTEKQTPEASERWETQPREVSKTDLESSAVESKPVVSSDEDSTAIDSANIPLTAKDTQEDSAESSAGASAPEKGETPDQIEVNKDLKESDETTSEEINLKAGAIESGRSDERENEEGKSGMQDEMDDNKDDDDEGEQELEFAGESKNEEPKKDPNRPRNAAWQAMLQKEAAMLKKQKKRKGGLVEAEAEEEEEEEVAGLEDFGFSVKKKKKDDDDEDPVNVELDEDDMEHIVDDVSDDEGDEEAGEAMRKKLEQKEEKERHKEMMRRMREGYDGRRGGIAGGVGARGIHRFDQLVAADNREDAKRLGLLNDDELDSENEGDDGEEGKKKDNNDEEDETALLDKILKDRFLHRSNVELEENFSEEEDDTEEQNEIGSNDSDDEEERNQERLAKRFTKRARMQRMEEMYAESQEFSQARLLDEDESMKIELKSMKNGLLRKRSVSSSRGSFSSMDTGSSSSLKRQKSTGSFGGPFIDKGASLSLALRQGRHTLKRKTSFLGGNKAGDSKETIGLIHKSVSLSHVVFKSYDSQSRSNMSNPSSSTHAPGLGPRRYSGSRSLFSKVSKK